jgi:hypothetical protein
MYNILQIPKPTYIDIGTNHPYKCNNTFYFYNRGSKGVCIEPDQQFAPLIKKYRKRDVFFANGCSGWKLGGVCVLCLPG